MPDDPARLEAWMRFGQPVETILDNYERVFDAWEVLGVRGIVIGRMVFQDGQGRYHAIFQPDARHYKRLGVQPPPPPQQMFADRRRKLDRLFAEAKRRRWSILIFAPNAGEGPGARDKYHRFASPYAWAARAVDTLAQFPEVDGGIIDGPEWGYEIEPGHRSDIFADLPETVRALAESMHYDFDELRQAAQRLRARLQDLNEQAVRSYSEAESAGTAGLLGSDPDLMSWVRFRTEVLTDTVKMLKGLMHEQRADLCLGMGPRSAAFAPLCGYDFRGLMKYLDYLLPKHYFWHRGVDGFYGSVYRWMRTLTEWNPGLSDEAALAVVKGVFGIELPGVKSAFDFERGFPEEFFEQVVIKETKAALAAVDRPEQVVPWVDVGRRPHRGDPMGSGDFIRILGASRQAGLKRFLYHNHAHLTAAEIEVMRHLCGNPAVPVPGGYEAPN